MLSLEIIGVLGALFAFLVYSMVQTAMAKSEAQERRRSEDVGAVAAEKGR